MTTDQRIEMMQKVETSIHYWLHWRDDEWPAFRRENTQAHDEQLDLLKTIRDQNSGIYYAQVAMLAVGAWLMTNMVLG